MDRGVLGKEEGYSCARTARECAVEGRVQRRALRQWSGSVCFGAPVGAKGSTPCNAPHKLWTPWRHHKR